MCACLAGLYVLHAQMCILNSKALFKLRLMPLQKAYIDPVFTPDYAQSDG